MKKNQYKDGKEHGYWEYYYANGNIMFKGYYKNGKDHGFWETYTSCGKPCFKGNYLKQGNVQKWVFNTQQKN